MYKEVHVVECGVLGEVPSRTEHEGDRGGDGGVGRRAMDTEMIVKGHIDVGRLIQQQGRTPAGETDILLM